MARNAGNGGIAKMPICLLCNTECTELALNVPSANKHYLCSKCGEYTVSLIALMQIDNITDEIKAMIKSTIFWNTRNRIPTELKSEMLNIDYWRNTDTLINKAYYLAKYFFEETKIKGLGSEIDRYSEKCCFCKDPEETYEVLRYLEEIGIVNYKKSEQYADNRLMCRVVYNQTMKSHAYMEFEKGIKDINEFKGVFMQGNISGSQIYINNKDGNVVVGNSNIQIKTESGITESQIIKELLSNNISIEDIDKIRNEIKELAEELNNTKPSIEKFDSILNKIKKIGGNTILAAMSFISKPEFIGVLKNLV